MEEGLCNKGVKGLSFFQGQLWRRAGGVEVHWSRGRNGILGSKLEGEVVKHGLNIVFHLDADLVAVAKIEVHCEVMMEVSVSLLHFAIMSVH